MISPAIMYLGKKTVSHSGTLMKYLEDITQEIKFVLPSLALPSLKL